MSAPFGDLGDAAVCARVAIALLKLYCKDPVIRKARPAIVIGIATARLDNMAFPTLRSCLLSLNAFCLEGGTSAQWLTGVIYRDMMGYTIRRCLHDAYKAKRRDPRVTNRGVRVADNSAQSGETPRTTVLKRRALLDIIEDFPKRDHGDD